MEIYEEDFSVSFIATYHNVLFTVIFVKTNLIKMYGNDPSPLGLAGV